MFDIGWPEMLVIAIVLIVVVGPKDLPGMLRNFGRTTSKLRSMAADFRKQFDEALKEAELDDVKNLVDDVRKLNPASDIKKALNPMQKAAEDVRSGLDAAMRPQPKPQTSAPATNAPASTVAPASEATKPATAAASKPATKARAASKAKKAPAAKAASAKPVAKTPPARSAAKPTPKSQPAKTAKASSASKGKAAS